ncbi:hypothetical protein D3C85_1392150 [compost metagenome]
MSTAPSKRLRLPSVSVPAPPLPADSTPALEMVTAPAMLPLPASVPPPSTRTAPLPVALPLALFRLSVPAAMVVPPV